MKTESIKIELVEWLSKLNDMNLLTSLWQIKKASEEGDWNDHLTKEQIESVMAGFEDLNQGRTLSSQEFWLTYGRKT